MRDHTKHFLAFQKKYWQARNEREEFLRELENAQNDAQLWNQLVAAVDALAFGSQLDYLIKIFESLSKADDFGPDQGNAKLRILAAELPVNISPVCSALVKVYCFAQLCIERSDLTSFTIENNVASLVDTSRLLERLRISSCFGENEERQRYNEQIVLKINRLRDSDPDPQKAVRKNANQYDHLYRVLCGTWFNAEHANELRKIVASLKVVQKLSGRIDGPILKDGPKEPNLWIYQGKELPGKIPSRCWCLAKAIYEANDRTLYFASLTEFWDHDPSNKQVLDCLRPLQNMFRENGCICSFSTSGTGAEQKVSFANVPPKQTGRKPRTSTSNASRMNRSHTKELKNNKKN